jgi:uncharacterized protein YdiU (UPF0061 family)
MRLNISDTFNKKLPSDSNIENTRRQIFEATHSYVSPRLPSNPKLIHASAEMTEAIGIDEKDLGSKAFLETFLGVKAEVSHGQIVMGSKFDIVLLEKI